jgi:hypothetical protein
LIAASSVVRAAWEPAAVVRSRVEIPAPAVVVTVAELSVKPAAVKAAAVLPEMLMPPLSVVAKVTNERLVVVSSSEVTTVPLIPVTDAVLPVRTRPPVDVKAIEPEELTAVTPVSVVAALMATAKLANLFVVTAMSVTLEVAVTDDAVTVEPLIEPVVNPAVKVPVKVPSAALVVLVLVAVAAVIPVVRSAKAAATSALAMSSVAVKVRPLTVAAWPAAKAEKVTTAVSVTATPVVDGATENVASALATDV